MTAEEHVEVPVTAARQIAAQYRKSMVVILSYDPVSALTHTTTYGLHTEEKEMAADVGERCARLICADGYRRLTSYEDYRFIDQGQRARQIELMQAALEQVLAWMTNVNAADPGTVASAVIDALRAAGVDKTKLDAAAIALIHGAAHI